MADRILIYDDDADILEVCAAILRMKNYEVLCKDNCRTLLADIEAYNPTVILMDNWLPEIGGVKSVQLIKSNLQFKNIPVVFLVPTAR
jgi:DNA-binding response OmpR family regulator